MATNVEIRSFNGELYNALMRKDEEKVINLCRSPKAPDRSLHICTIHNDTVLRMATYTKQGNLVLNLLTDLPNNLHHKLTLTNRDGNTILHEVANSNQALDVAKAVLEKAPESLLGMRNHVGETALFRAALYGKIDVFKFLAAAFFRSNQADPQSFLRRNDKTTVLHISILHQHFKLARYIAENYEHLIGEKDMDGMTALQLLSRNPSAFRKRSQDGFLKRLIKTNKFFSWANQEVVDKKKRRYNAALRLAKFLIEKDTSWEATNFGIDQSKRKLEECGVSFNASPMENGGIKGTEEWGREGETASSLNALSMENGSINGTEGRGGGGEGGIQGTEERGREGETPSSLNALSMENGSIKGTEGRGGEGEGDTPLSFNALSKENGGIQGTKGGEGDTPLFLATKSGCVVIVREILKLYPQAVEFIDEKGRNILHVAIKYRQKGIFKLVKRMKLPMRRLVQNVDNKGNSILHMAARKRKHYVPENMPDGPAAELENELRWFESVKRVTPSHLINLRNPKKQTADELFVITNTNLCNLAKEHLKRTSEGCSILAVLIATVSFAAAYTVPGGPNQNSGLPLLLYQPLFVVFIATDVLSLVLALIALLSFLSILSSRFCIADYKQLLPRKFGIGIICLFHSVSMMMIAFAATISLMIHAEERWIKIALSATSFLPVGIVAKSMISTTYKYLLMNARKTSPWSIDFFPLPVQSKITKLKSLLSSSSSHYAAPQTPRSNV